MLLRSNFSSFPQYFQYICTLGVKLHIHSVKGGCSINCFFLSSANLISRRTDIAKCFIETLGVRDNESRLFTCLRMIKAIKRIGNKQNKNLCPYANVMFSLHNCVVPTLLGWTVWTGTLANGADPDQMSQNTTSDQGLLCLLTLQKVNSFAAKFQTTFVVCFCFKLTIEWKKMFICKVERLNVKQRRSR